MTSKKHPSQPQPRTRRAATFSAPPLLRGLNPQQQRAAMTTEGPVLILAGAGSGKTRTLTHRIAYLLTGRGVPAANVLAVTFTNKAAEEMRQRLRELLGGRAALPPIGTFHSFCARLLRRHGEAVSLPPTFTIYNEDEASSVMKTLMTEASIPPKTISPRAIVNIIGRWKDALLTPQEAHAQAHDSWEEQVATLWDRYDARLLEQHVVDFDSLLYLVVLLLQRDRELRAALEAQYRYISVDEYQDTNNSQAVLLTLLTGTTRNLCVVGDDAQAIYGWRGARVEQIRQFATKFPGCTAVTLDQNYRSTQAILDAANALIGHSQEALPKTLWTAKRGGAPPRLLRASDEQDEGRRILRAFQRIFRETFFGPGDAAILYRTNAQSRALEEACLAAGVPYDIVGGLTFYERKEIKDVVAYLRLIQNPRDALAFRRIANVPTRGVGERTMEICLVEARARQVDPLHPEVRALIPEARRQGLAALAASLDRLRASLTSVRPLDLLDALLREVPLRSWLREEERRTRGKPDPGESRYENILELRTVAERHETLDEFLAELSLMSDLEKSARRDHRPRMKLMTIHAAKGLEFPIVAVAGMEEGLLPHQQSLHTAAGLEEERRLCYVALTRAKEILFLSYARTRTIYGSRIETTPSPFLDDLPSIEGDATDALPDSGIEILGGEEPTITLWEELPFFVVGDAVHHTHFGEGTVEGIRGAILTVRFRTGVKRLDSTQASLTRTAEIE